MKDTLCEKLIHLATSQECMAELADKMEQWSYSQLNMERSAFESMNESDKVLNMSKEGIHLTGLLKEANNKIAEVREAEKINELVEAINVLFVNISEAALNANEILHTMEAEIAFQKEIEEDIKTTIVHVSESVDTTLAFTELLMADI